MTSTLTAWPVVPGTGVKKEQVGDDFEDPDWEYFPNLPKSSRETDERERRPWGVSKNGRWIEGPHRGTPDFLRRVATPEGGLPGSEGSLLIRTLNAGVPGRYSRKGEQDDLLVNTVPRLGGYMSVSRTPSVVVRVYVPPLDQWENRSGTSFAFRADLRGGPPRGKTEPYWPGIFFQLRRETDRRYNEDSAFLILRAGRSGHDFMGPEITQTGWWTLGMSFTPDGQVHFYARPGVEDLTAEDHLSSQYCYGFRAQTFHTCFFNILTRDDGRTWSTPWIIDDLSLYEVGNSRRMARK
jgi:hypothetical protein